MKHQLFSHRMKQSRGEHPDVYQYDEIPEYLRVQIIHIITEVIGEANRHIDSNSISNQVFAAIHKTLCKEYGVFTLVISGQPENKDPFRTITDFDAIYNYMLNTESTEECLDIIELTFFHINTRVRKQYHSFVRYGTTLTPDEAVTELNERFKIAGVGYQFLENQLIRIDSQYIHSEVVKPALNILEGNKYFDGAKDEFLSAHTHYRNKKYKETLVDCLKSFESLLKSLCEKNHWEYHQNDAAKKLINICLTNNLVPQYMQVQFSTFRGLLESGIPTIRNKEGGHGQGSEIKEVSEAMASYALHLTATNIVFLARCDASQ